MKVQSTSVILLETMLIFALLFSILPVGEAKAQTAPTLMVMGTTADGEAMAGDLATGYILETTNDPAIDHLIQFAAETVSSEQLADEYFGLYLVDSTVSAADLKAYYVAHGTPSEPIDFLGYLQDAVDGLTPFVYIKGHADLSVTLVDAAKHDLLSEVHDMTVPDDYPLGTYTVEGQIEDLAGNTTTVTLILIVSGDREGPELTITGTTADGEAMAGDLATGYILETTNDPAIDHLIQFAAETVSSEQLADEYFGLYLVDSTVSAADLKAYYVAHGTPSEPIDFLGYLQDAVDGLTPFVYIKGHADLSVTLVDAAKHDLLSEVHDMTVPDDYPLGTYTVEGQIEDLAGNTTTVTLILIVESSPPTDIELSNASVDENSSIGTYVGIFSTIDSDKIDTFIYKLVNDAVYPDNDSFIVESDTLKTASFFNYEAKSQYIIRVSVTDRGDKLYEEEFIITISDVNEAPVAVDDSFSTLENDALHVAAPGILSNDTDPENDVLTAHIVTHPPA